MKDQHRATADQWTAVKALASGGVAYSCILELLHRIEALEATQPEHLINPEREKVAQELSQDCGFAPRWPEVQLCAATQPAKSNHPAKTDSSLLSRVAAVIENGAACDRAPERIARNAIREVAAWLISNPDHHSPPALVFASEQEAER
jgi:hypothetical protein